MIYILVPNNARKLLVIRCLKMKVSDMNTINPSDKANTSIISGDPVLYWKMKKMMIATMKLKIAGIANSDLFLCSLTVARKCS